MTRNLSTAEPTIRRQELGAELQRLRKAAGFTLDQAARRINVSASKLCRIEGGSRTATLDEIGGLLAIYTEDGATRTQLLALARDCGERGWWQHNYPEPHERQRTLITLESRADRIVAFEPIVVPGLLQTGEYTRALKEQSGMLTEDEIEYGMDERVRRQSVMLRRQPPNFLAIIDELALHRVVGGPDVLRRQLDYLVRASQQTHVTVQVIPNRGGNAGNLGPFTLIGQPERPPVVFVAQPASNLFIEQQDQVAVYRNVLENLLSAALDETQSRHLIATLASAVTQERASDEPHRPRHLGMA